MTNQDDIDDKKYVAAVMGIGGMCMFCAGQIVFLAALFGWLGAGAGMMLGGVFMVAASFKGLGLIEGAEV